MKPDLKRFLDVAAAHVMMNVAPALNSYEQSGAMLLGVMLMALNEELERAASRRVEENRALREIFARATDMVIDSELSERLVRASKGNETSFAISDLERANAELRALLIELHAYVEGVDTPDARRVEAEIWRELAASTERRRLMMAPY